jgi:hypothetical protein
MNMKLLVGLSALLIASNANATVTLNFQFGQLTDSSATTLQDTALWAIIYDDNGDGTLPGGLDGNSSLTEADRTAANAAFLGVNIQKDTVVDGDKILFTGEIEGSLGDGIVGDQRNFDLNSLGLATGVRWGFYWFPGLTTASTNLPSSDPFEIGAIQEDNANTGSGGNAGMTIPSDGANVVVAYFDNTTSGNASGLDEDRFQAILVPEPSALLLGVLGGLALLRRRRS